MKIIRVVCGDVLLSNLRRICRRLKNKVMLTDNDYKFSYDFHRTFEDVNCDVGMILRKLGLLLTTWSRNGGDCG